MRQRGSITLFMLGLCMMMLLLGGISLDLWRAFSERRALAAAADAAALAGAGAVDTGTYRATGEIELDVAAARRRALASLAGQLDRRALRRSTVTADRRSVTVEVDGTVAFTLLRLLPTGSDFSVRVSARAEPRASDVPPRS